MIEDPGDALTLLFDRISRKLSIAEFKVEFSRFWKKELAERNYLSEIRFSRARCKKLMDEVKPVANFLKWKKLRNGFFQFPLNDQIPDWFLWVEGSVQPQRIEVTIAQGRARFYLMRELVERGTGRGFVELQDNENVTDFDSVFEREADGYTTDQALASTKKAIELCLMRKNDEKYASMDLLIEGPLNVATLPRERWKAIRTDLINAARGMPFREIYVIGDGSKHPICFRIK
jgi:hypothetical protein